MANRPQQLTRPPPRTWTRTDFPALRAFVQRVPPATIARLYFDPDTAASAVSGRVTPELASDTSYYPFRFANRRAPCNLWNAAIS